MGIVGFSRSTRSGIPAAACRPVLVLPGATQFTRMAWLAAGGQATKVEKFEVNSVRSTELATMDEMEKFYEHLEVTLVNIGFLDPEKPRHLMARLRRLYGRSAVNRSEMSILRGILTETQKAANGEPYKRKDQ